MNLVAGDVLIDRKTKRKFPIESVVDGHVYLELGNRKVKRAFGQIKKHMNKFIILRKGQKLEEDLAFFCPIKNQMVILSAGTIFLGEV